MASQYPESQPGRQPDHLIVGKVVAAWGARGEIRVLPLTDFPEERLAPQREVCIDGRPLTIAKSHQHKGQFILKLDTVNGVEAAQKLRGKHLTVPLTSAMSLSQGQYYHFQLLGLEVVSSEGAPIGRIERILPTGSNDVYVTDGPCGEVLIPATEDVIKLIDIERGQMIIEIIDGLLG